MIALLLAQTIPLPGERCTPLPAPSSPRQRADPRRPDRRRRSEPTHSSGRDPHRRAGKWITPGLIDGAGQLAW